MKYSIKYAGKDFSFLESNENMKGTRKKRQVQDKKGRFAVFKYEKEEYCCSEACSEKLCYEIANVLGYPCAQIELARDEEGFLGILNYDFVVNSTVEHIDIVSFINSQNQGREEYYTISNIKEVLDKMNEDLFLGFIRIMIFDALVGETDRHEENWGLTHKQEQYFISPLYDNGCSLLNKFKNEEYAQRYYHSDELFENYIRKSKTYIYKENHVRKYRHFELIQYLKDLYPDFVKGELENLQKLSDEKIERIVLKIPDELLTDIHKKYIILYLKKRRNILLGLEESS